jgi:hypothetical protein
LTQDSKTKNSKLKTQKRFELREVRPSNESRDRIVADFPLPSTSADPVSLADLDGRVDTDLRLPTIAFVHAGRALPLALDGGMSPLVIAWSMAFSLLNDVMVAIGICGLADAVHRFVRGIPYFHHPGHWLLAIAGGVGLMEVLGVYLRRFLLVFEGDVLYSVDLQTVFALGEVLTAAIQVIAFSLAVKFCGARGWWKILFVVLAMVGLIGLLRESYSLLTQPYVRVQYLSWVPWEWTSSQLSGIQFSLQVAVIPFLPATILVLLAAVLGDRGKSSRDWPHWLGVLMVFWITTRNLFHATTMVGFWIRGM